ncbi:MAG: LuxR C-terminal-related transcriptional regulator [Trebonia sp.]
MVLLGRGEERDRVDRVIAAARQGLSGVLVLRGEPGIGKTALLDYAVGVAADMEIARIEAVESEMELGFAGLHQLLLPYLGAAGTLPAPQRDALNGAFGLHAHGPPDRFLVALATLTLLSHAASKRGLLCVVDDAQWLDRESAAAVAFVARRLHADAIAVLIGVRELSDETGFTGLPAIQLPGLPPPEARELLGAGIAGLDEEVGTRIVAQTRGNPLALIEVAGELTPGQLAGEEPLPELLPAGRQLQSRFLRQARELPPAAQTLLLTAAADPTGDPALLWRAGRDLGFAPDSAAPAQAKDLLDIGSVIRFRHPLVRSAVYHSAAPIDRRRVHKALAAATDPGRDPDRRAWHRSESAAEPDEEVAAGLERAAGRAATRGGWAASAGFLTRAASLSPDPAERARRLLAAASAEAIAGFPRKAQQLLGTSLDRPADPLQDGLAKRTQGAIYHALRRPAEAAAVLLAAGADLAALDVRLARGALLDALAAARISGPLALTGATDTEIAKAARSLPLPAADVATIGDLLLDADAALALDDRQTAARLAKRAITALGQDQSESAEMLGWLEAACRLAGALGDSAALRALSGRLERQARRQGAPSSLATGLLYTGTAELLDGSLDGALALYTERAAIDAVHGDDYCSGELVVMAWRGRDGETRTQAAVFAAAARADGQGWKLSWIEYALCVLELGLGHYQEALASAPSAFEENPWLSAFAFPDYIEAAVRSGNDAPAGEALARMSGRIPADAPPQAIGLLARSRALLAADQDAEALYIEALGHLGQSPGTVHLARTQLLYGEWLRRRKRRTEAREHLRAAYATFENMGAVGFAERARLELVATGETARKRSPETRNDLTPQETQIALLASRGATNPEIASQLFISPYTVDYHLRKVFRKLDLTSRRQLARVTLNGS